MRERWIGAIVLIVIAAIMVPWLMTHAHHPRNNLQAMAFAATAPTAGKPAAAALALPPATDAGAVSGLIPHVARVPQSITIPVSSALAPVPAPRQTTPRRVAQAHASKQTPSRQSTTTQSAVPRKSSRKVAQQAVPKSSTHAQDLSRRGASQQASAPAQAAPAHEPSEPSLGQGILHKGDWYVQVASFASHANAAQMAILLTRAGYHAFLSTNQSGGTLFYRVRVGPYPSENRAQAVAPGLSAISGSQVVVRQADSSDG